MKAKHAIITDECRTNRGDEGAIDEALRRLREEFLVLATIWPIGQGTRFNVILDLEVKDGKCDPQSPQDPENPSAYWIVRPEYSLNGSGGGRADTYAELLELIKHALAYSPTGKVEVEEHHGKVIHNAVEPSALKRIRKRLAVQFCLPLNRCENWKAGLHD